MFICSETNSNSFLEQLREAREKREAGRIKDVAAVKIQSWTRGWLVRSHSQNIIRKNFDSHFGPEFSSSLASKKELPPTHQVFKDACKLMKIFDQEKDSSRLECYTRYLLVSIESEEKKLSCVSCAMDRTLTLRWIQHVKEVVSLASQQLQILQVDLANENRLILLYLHLLLTFTATTTWKLLQMEAYQPLKPALNKFTNNILSDITSKGMHFSLQQVLTKGLCRSKCALSGPVIVTILTLSLRPLILVDQPNNLFLFTIHILSVPALVHHLTVEARDGIDIMIKNEIFEKVILYLCREQNLKVVFDTLEGCYALCLLANIIHLGYLKSDVLQSQDYYSKFSFVVTQCLVKCGEYVSSNQSSLTQWHPLLGWFSQTLDPYLNESMSLIRIQLQLLWCGSLLKLMFQPVQSLISKNSDTLPKKELHPENIPLGRQKNFFKKTFEGSLNSVFGIHKEPFGSNSKQTRLALTFEGSEIVPLWKICSMYHVATSTLSQLKMDILTGICHKSDILQGLWSLLSSLGLNNSLKFYLHQLSVQKENSPHIHFLILFCEASTHLISVLDDLEMYEQQKPFTLDDYRAMSSFLNCLIFKMIKCRLVNLDDLSGSELFYSAHNLLKLLYTRNYRRPFVDDSHWYIAEVSGPSLISDLEKEKKVAKALMQAVPHILPHHERVLLFRNFIKVDKSSLPFYDLGDSLSTSTLITVRRDTLVEDGYRQLASLSSSALKGVIRVRFINQQGLDEAGIDQDGVFKEFLEETLKRIFDPSLNLFRLTSEERLFPSPISSLTENHLLLFEFTGKMLGKAVYEGILVDSPFATFFLSQVIGEQQTSLYSSIDELPSLDPQLYKNLAYVKHYEGDVSDLGLTFSHDEDYLGQVMNHELRPGGKSMAVTNENRIAYIHLIGHFKLHTQIKDQTRAFVRGFRSIIRQGWMMIFSPTEFQRIISGDNINLNIQDLRQNTHYYGGFHDKHRVICWLWDVLQNDFTEEEKRLFLKFVTSCSKPPLLGFSNLEPPFSIRCVEVNDDEDTGDTVGSVIRGFFAIRKDSVSRLPTSSTCFNLLKLPNYQRKSNLKEKLRYAIHSNTGFELS